MPPSDKNEGTSCSDSKEERDNKSQDFIKGKERNRSSTIETEPADFEKHKEPEIADIKITEHGTVTNIPLFTAKSSTLKCSENDQMKTFDPGECSSNESTMNNQNGFPLKFPLNNCNNVAKKNKNYKAGSKINKLADMLAKRSQNIVEMTQNVTSEIITDIISAPKVECNVDAVGISDLAKNDDKLDYSDVFCEKTGIKKPIDSINESQNKSAPNECSENLLKLQPQLSHKCCSDVGEIIMQETPVSGINALKEHLIRSETDGSTKIKKEIRKNLKNIELSLILPEKKRRSSPRNKLVNSDVNKECINQEDKSSAKNIKQQEECVGSLSLLNEETKSFFKVNSVKRIEKLKSVKQRKPRRLVETSTQTTSIDFVKDEGSKLVVKSESETVFQSREDVDAEEASAEKKEVPMSESEGEKDFEENSEPGVMLSGEDNLETQVPDDKSASLDHTDSSMKSDSEDNPEDVKPETESADADKCVYACMYCTASFISKAECKEHEKSHSPKKNKHITKCQFCNKQYPSFYDLKLHCIKNHPNKYAYCVKCDERFCEKSQLYSHNKSLHLTKAMEAAQNLVKIQETLGIRPREKRKEEPEESKKLNDRKIGGGGSNKSGAVKSDLKVDVSFDLAKKSATSPRAPQKISPRENKTEEQLLEMEMLFYSHLSGNIKENLTNHLDGKIDKNGNPIQTDALNDSSDSYQKVKSSALLSAVTASSSGAPEPVSRAPSPYQTRSKTPNPLPPTAKKFKKLPNWQQKFWEKYNFPTNYRYEHRFWDKNYFNAEKSAFYLKDLSCLDIKTQLTMRENIKKLDNIKINEENNKSDELTFPGYLSLVPKLNYENNAKVDGESPIYDCLKNKSQIGKDEKKTLKSPGSDLNRSRRKNSADNSSKRQNEKNAGKSSDGAKMMTRRQSVIELSKVSKKNEDEVKKRKGSLDATETQKMTLRRQISLDNLQRICGPENRSKTDKTPQSSQSNENESENLSMPCTGLAEISGEWVRPRSYLCGTCCAKFTNLWELEDHKWVSHPNVWCTHYEFEDEKIDKLFNRSDAEAVDDSGPSDNSTPVSKLKLTDLYKRYLLPHGSLKTAKLVPNMSFPEQCTKCNKNCMSLSEMHKHMLDCGGDTTWFLTMYSSPMTIKRKWRPFGSRRRKQIGRRVLKRNIPNSTNIRPYHYQHRIRTKPGDVETIQKMLANLPEKRARRAINFDEIKTRSQATIHSNRLLRKRFKVSFGSNIMRLKALKQQRQVKPAKKESTTTDTSSESTPTGSPKRRNKQKENSQSPKDENDSLETVQQNAKDESKKKSGKQKSKRENNQKQDKKGSKKDKKNIKGKNEKPLTRSSSAGSIEMKKKKGQSGEKNQAVPYVEITDEGRINLKCKKNEKSKQKSKKKESQKITSGKSLKKELADADSSSFVNEEMTGKKKTKTENEDEVAVEVEPFEMTEENKGEVKKGKKGKMSNKNILRLKSNDKEKTELIKRIRKTLKNSKKILEKRENKDRNERRRSLRLQTLHLTDISPKSCEDIFSFEKHFKEIGECSSSPENKGIPPLNMQKDILSSKKSTKTARNLRGVVDLKLSAGEYACEETSSIRRSSRTLPGTFTEEKVETSPSDPSQKVFPGSNIKKIPDILQSNSSGSNRSELAETLKRSPASETLRNIKPSEDTSHPLIGFEFETIKKPGRIQKVPRDPVPDAQPGKSVSNLRASKAFPQYFVDKPCESGSNDLAEMPILDKEEPVRGRSIRKSETDIPVLMPFENEGKMSKNGKEQKGGKRKGIITFRVVNKKRKLPEKLNPLKIVKEMEVVTVKDDERSKTNLKKRKRNQTVRETTLGDQKLPKTPKVKKYFLGICPNEIDKGGDSKDESGSDSEPLITLVMGQKCKEKVEASPEASVESSSSQLDEFRKASSEEKELLSESELKNAEENLTSEVNEAPAPATEMDKKPLPQSIGVAEENAAAFIPLNSDSSSQKIENEIPIETGPKKNLPIKSLQGLKMTVKLKDATTKIIDSSTVPSPEIQIKAVGNEISDNGSKNVEEPPPPEVNEVKVERRSRRVSKEIKSTNEFIIDDPLILVDELWSDLDSDSDSSKKRSRKNKKKTAKRKSYEDKKENSVNLEELLRNFGERKNSDTKPENEAKKLPNSKRERKVKTYLEKRKKLENRFKFEERSHRRLTLRLFKFYKKRRNLGGLGQRLLTMKKKEMNKAKADFKALPPLPFLAAEIKENPVQIIQCGGQKGKVMKKTFKKFEGKFGPNIQMKISLPLQSINNLAVLNNNHLTDVGEVEEKVEDFSDSSQREKEDDTGIESYGFKTEDSSETVDINLKDEELFETGDLKLKSKRSETIIDKIFYCEICQTYYYSPSQLKIHKLSNRHKMKELELSLGDKKFVVDERGQISEEMKKEKSVAEAPREIVKEVINICTDINPTENVDPEKLNDDTSEMPILEGPFIENPFVRLGMDAANPPPKPSPPPPNVFGFTEDCLKDIQKAIGCTDEEMLILTLLGENSIEIENDILDLDSCQPVTSNQTTMKSENVEEVKEKETSNGLFKMDFKKRITSALARLVNKAVLNLLQKYKNSNRTGISPEALSFLVKLTKVNDKKNLLELDELLKSEAEGESSNRIFLNEDEKKDVGYKCLCTVCGARFQSESTKEWHVIRCHRSQTAKNFEESSPDPVSVNEDDKEEEIPYKYLCTLCGARFQKESTRECHIARAHRSKLSKNLEEPSSSPVFIREEDKKEKNIPYKYLCTICGSRFQKESMWECHIKRSHKSKGKKSVEEMQVAQTTYEDDWSSTWTYDINDELPGSVETPQFLCSDCGINFMSPQEVLDHQKVEHMVQKDPELNESGPLQSSTIGSSDEIIKGKRTPRRGPKHLSKAELDQQRIIANNELRKLDRKFCSKNKSNKVKWGIDALKFTVEKENKIIADQEEKEVPCEETEKPQFEPKTVEVVPKLNLSRTNNIPEFKVVQKSSCLNRFQRILDNKMKRKGTRNDIKGIEDKECFDKEFTEPVPVIKRERKKKPNRCPSKKETGRKVLDVYDFNDSESEPEPVMFSHVKKGGPSQSPTKLKLIKVKDLNGTSKNKADSTTKDPETEDYDSEDSLPLSLVKRTKTEEEDGDIRADEQVEKSEGILEQVEYLIEQLENQTNHPQAKEEEKDVEDVENDKEQDFTQKEEETKADPEYVGEEISVDSQPETFRVSLENKFLQLESIATKKKSPEPDENTYESQESVSSEDKSREIPNEKPESNLPVVDSSQGISDEEDSLPLVLISKKNDSCDPELSRESSKKEFETPQDFEPRDVAEEEEEEDEKVPSENGLDSPKASLDSVSMFSRNESDVLGEKSEKSFETLNGNVIYRRNDSMSGFDSDLSDYESLDAEKRIICRESGGSLIKEVMEKEDVVIVCSKKEQDISKGVKKKQKEPTKRKKQNSESFHRKKKILPLLSATLEENNFRRSESPKLNKDVIMKKIWSKRRFMDDHQDDSENSLPSRENDTIENLMNDDSHSEIDKEIIMKKIWNKKRIEHDNESGEIQVTRPDDIKINQTQISDEVVIKCGPKAKVTPKRRKSRSSTKESSKERIMRKIWSGKCAFQTKAALKTYDSDIIPSSKESDALEEQHRVKKRRRSSNCLSPKKSKLISDGEKSDEDDLDSLLEEIEREEVEKAIRLEFLQLRRSEKANVEGGKETGTVGLFTETCHKHGRDLTERKRKRIRKNVKHPRKNMLKKRKFMKKPCVKAQQQEPEEDSSAGMGELAENRLKGDAESSEAGGNKKSFDTESKMKNRKHKKHRHKHHHHKHKHKKSKHRKYIVRKHKMKHKSMDCAKEKCEDFENFSILEKMCDDIPSQIEKQSQKRFTTELNTLDTKLDEILMSTSSPFDCKAKDCEEVFYEGRRIETDRNYGIDTSNIYDFVDDDSGFLCESKMRCGQSKGNACDLGGSFASYSNQSESSELEQPTDVRDRL